MLRDHDDRHGGGHRGDPARCEHGAGHDDAVGSQLEEGVERLVLCGRGPSSRVEQGVVTGTERGRLDPVDHLGEVGVVQIGDHHADQIAAAADETPRDGVRPVPDLLGGARHGRALLVAHVGLVPEHERDEGLRDPGSLRDVDDRGVPASRASAVARGRSPAHTPGL